MVSSVDRAQQSLADPPDAAGAEEDFDGAVEIAELQVIAVRQHVDGNSRAIGGHDLRARLVDGIDHPARQIPCVLHRERGDARGGARLVEGEHPVDIDHLPLGGENQPRHRLAGREQVRSLVEIDFDDPAAIRHAQRS
ncbi:MAG: hypothetical protein NT133_11880 [Alphaproteobacteria bacterium]|nr:hypothetical protein [Alphaproteobacteria bacterium]